MNTLTHEITQDVDQVAQSLSMEENLLALECAQKVLNHLKRHQTNSKQGSYHSNIETLENIIKVHKAYAKIDLAYGSLQRQSA